MPGCTTAGYTLHTCEKCGDSYRDSEVPPTGHQTAEGVTPCLSHSCTVCGADFAEPHDSITENVAATCQHAGYTSYTCTRCGDSYKEETAPRTDHVYASDDPCYLQECIFCGHGELPTHDLQLVAVIRPATLVHEGEGDFICRLCEKEFRKPIAIAEPEGFGTPILYFEGSLSGISKENEGQLLLRYVSEDLTFSGAATLKVQGASSSGFPKKNYTMKLYEDATFAKRKEIDPFGWGKESKYCLKANYIDFSQARNVVSGRLFGDAVRSRVGANPRLLSAPNGGAVDGEPVLVYVNGEYHGFYTMNIPKDEWMFGIKSKEGGQQAILFVDDWTESGALNEPIATDYANGWKVEYCSTEDDSWVRESFNNMMAFLQNHDGSALRNGLRSYLDVDAAIDHMLFIYMICGQDNLSKNTLWVTYDGRLWIPSVYDMDGTWGLYWHGQSYYEVDRTVPRLRSDGSVDAKANNLLWKKLFRYYREEVKARYEELRRDAMSNGAITLRFDEFFDSVPPEFYAAEREKWYEVPSQTTNNRDQIITFMKARMKRLDAFFASL